MTPDDTPVSRSKRTRQFAYEFDTLGKLVCAAPGTTLDTDAMIQRKLHEARDAFRRLADTILALRAAQSPQARDEGEAVEGWVLVPREPHFHQLAAGQDALGPRRPSGACL